MIAAVVEPALVAVIVLVLLALLLVALRRRTFLRRGALDCGYRRMTGSGRWRVGLLEVGHDELLWHRVLSPGGARRVLPRDRTAVIGQRELQGGEIRLFGRGARVLRCRVDGQEVELAVASDGATGLLAWLEAAPPGRSVR